MQNIAFCFNSFIQVSFLSFFIPIGQFRGSDKRSPNVSCTSFWLPPALPPHNGVFLMREGRQLISQSVLWDRFLSPGVGSQCQMFPHCSVEFGWVVLRLVPSDLLCYSSACPAFPQFFSILHFLCPRDANIISPLSHPQYSSSEQIVACQRIPSLILFKSSSHCPILIQLQENQLTRNRYIYTYICMYICMHTHPLHTFTWSPEDP